MKKKLLLAFGNFVILSIAFLLVAWLKPATHRIVIPQYIRPFIYFSILWIITSSIVGKYRVNFSDSFFKCVKILLISNITILSLISIGAVLSQSLTFSRLILFGTVGVTTIIEILGFYIFCYDNSLSRYAKDKLKIEEEEESSNSLISSDVTKKLIIELETDSHIDNRVLTFIKDQIGTKAFDYIKEFIDISPSSVKVLAIHDFFSVITLPFKEYTGIVNIRKLNHLNGINNTMSEINKKLPVGGIFIGCVETYNSRTNRHKKRFGILFYITEPFDFLIKRIFPRFKLTKNIQRMLHIRISRAISLTETLGRLVLKGFEIVDYKEIDNVVWFIGRKIDIAHNATQNYGLIFKKSCAGKNGKVINVYKMRTMHPYSEYLQSYLIKNHGYSDNGHGKIKDDFRISFWGKFLRATWLDEAPQLINVLKGEMNLMGVRPVRPARLKEFPEDIIILRQRFNPGCIPPYVSLLMGDEEGNIEAERIYLNEKLKSPIKTDIKYFVKGLYNMLTGKIKSS